MKVLTSDPVTSRPIDGENMKIVTDLIFLGSKITTDGNCNNEIKKHQLLGRKAMMHLFAAAAAAKSLQSYSL